MLVSLRYLLIAKYHIEAVQVFMPKAVWPNAKLPLGIDAKKSGIINLNTIQALINNRQPEPINQFFTINATFVLKSTLQINQI